MAEIEDKRLKEIRRHECTGRPLDDVSFVERLESVSGKSLRRRKPGPKTRGRRIKYGVPGNSVKFNLDDKWYKYREDAIRQIAADWCELHKIPFKKE